MTSRAAARVDLAAPDRRHLHTGNHHEPLFVWLAIGHAAALLVVPSIPLIAIGLWWNANTIAHNFIHRPFFRSRSANRGFSVFLSLVLGVPQSLWRQRHLRHHAETRLGDAVRTTPRPLPIVIETFLVLTLWSAIVALAPSFFLQVYLPGWALGLTLCQLQGYFEHARGTTSHYGRLYNWLFFNDGFHVEHHLRPGTPWHELPALRRPAPDGSRWPAVLRWLDAFGLELLERAVLRSSVMQHFALRWHERAFRELLPRLGPVARITIVGGGLFPRSALILRRLLPHAAITIIDASADNLESAKRFLDDDVTFVHATHTPGAPLDGDLVVMPLAYRGDRRRIYLDPPAARVLVHDWIWSPRPVTARVSWWLLKRVNLIQR